jgi:hypothetical protein
MARQFTTQILLPNDPASSLQAATKQYVDNGLGGRQPVDADLTAIAVLTPTDGDVLQRVSGSWVNRTVAQLKSALGYTASDVGAQPVDTDLTTIAGLTPTDGDVLQRVSGAWTSGPPAAPDPPAWSTHVETLTDSTSVTPDALSGLIQVGVWTCATATPTLNPPDNGSQGQTYRVIVLGSGADRVITLSGFVASTDDPTAAVTVPSGKWCSLIFEYISAIGWLYEGKKTQS